MRLPIATLLNAAVVVIGGGIGAALGDRLPARIRDGVLAAIGLVTLVVGMQSAVVTQNIVIPLLALTFGTVIGELIEIERRLESVGVRLRERFASGDHGRFVEGFVAATLIATVGPLAILGSLAEGATGDHELLLIKSALDAFMALGVAAAYGIGVAFAAIGVLLVQVPLTVLGSLVGDGISGRVLLEIEATGGIIILAIGFRLLEIRKLPVASMLPALILAPGLLWLGERLVAA